MIVMLIQGSLTNLNNQFIHYQTISRGRNNRSDLGNTYQFNQSGGRGEGRGLIKFNKTFTPSDLKFMLTDGQPGLEMGIVFFGLTKFFVEKGVVQKKRTMDIKIDCSEK